MRSDDAAGLTGQRIRVTLEFSRSDDPLLFDALVQLKKGRRRVARLRTLAHDGLLAAVTKPGTPSHIAAERPGIPWDLVDTGERSGLAVLDSKLTAGIFDAPLDE